MEGKTPVELWISIGSALVSLIALGVGLYNRYRTTLKEKTEVTRMLRERLLAAEADIGEVKLPQTLLGRKNITIWRKSPDIWQRFGPLFQVFEDLSLMKERGFVDEDLARAYFAERFRFYQEEVFGEVESMDTRDSLLLARIQKLGSWLAPRPVEVEAANEAHNMVNRQERMRETFDVELRKGLMSIFPTATRIENERDSFDDVYRVFSDDASLGIFRLDVSLFHRRTANETEEVVALLLSLFRDKGLAIWQEHPEAVGQVKEEWRIYPKANRSETTIDLVFAISASEER